MQIAEYGKNRVSQFEISAKQKVQFADDAYRYYIVTLEAEQSLVEADLKSFTVCPLNSSTDFLATEVSKLQNIDANSVLQFENTSAEIKVIRGSSSFLVSGTLQSAESKPTVELRTKETVKRVSKPWGYELWLNNEHPKYAFKEIFIKKGTKTSLQYHRMKRETNVLVSGAAVLHYCGNSEAQIDLVQPADIAQIQLNAIASIDVFPNTLHRLEALEDVLLFETSTPNLDDVVRIQDDASRGHGRIQSEHGKS